MRIATAQSGLITRTAEQKYQNLSIGPNVDRHVRESTKAFGQRTGEHDEKLNTILRPATIFPGQVNHHAV